MTDRRRRSLRAERTTDVTRYRGIALAALAAAAAVAIVTVALPGARSGSPGPLSPGHRIAALGCASCHGGPSVAAACTTCHGPHPSARPAHRALAERGGLRCPACHTGHGEGGVALFPDGRAVRYGAGGETAAPATAFHRAQPTRVPVIAARACARCHALASPADPLASCLLAGQDRFGADRPTACFDEHAAVRAASGAIAPRAAAWDAARDVAAAVPLPRALHRAPGAPWWWLAVGMIAALVMVGGVRTADRRRARRRGSATATVSATAAATVSATATATATAATVSATATATGSATARRCLPVIDTTTCLGCYACVDACPYDVLEIQRYIAVVARPDDCCGLILCEQKCPNGSLAITFADAPGTAAIALDPTSLESTTVPGLYLAGDVSGQPLIRTAINQGARAIAAIAARLPRRRDRDRDRDDALDVVIIGAGPAGLSASLAAGEHGLRYVTLEQTAVVDSIRSFPRGKLVIDPDLPNESSLWLAEATKEELLARWTRTIRETRPAIREGVRVTAIRPRTTPTSGFEIEAVDRDGGALALRAAHVVIAIGRRGTPRKLAVEIPAAFADHVHYSLADARSFAGQRVVVVGLGDVAMEAAIALASQPGTTVVVVARGGEFRRGKARNIAELRRRAAGGTVVLRWHSEVTAIAPNRVTLATPAGSAAIECDAVFALIGAIPAEDLLRGVGLLGPSAETPTEIVSGGRPCESEP